MEAKINIAEILKDKPQGIKLYDLLRNIGVELDKVHTTDVGTYIECTSTNEVGSTLLFDYSKLGTEDSWLEGLQILLPSKEMRDWSKFAWKKGDVLIMDGYRVVFDKWLNNDYTRFNAVHLITSTGGYIDKPLQNRYSPISNFITRNWRKMTDAETKIYMDSLERECGGKLNRETLVVEKPHPELKDGDIAYADYGHKQAVFIVSGKTDLSEGYNSFIALDLRGLTLDMGCMSFFKEDLCKLRLATEEEKQQLFDALAKKGKAWNSENKEVVNLKPKVELKPFDKVLSRRCSEDYWVLNFYSHKTDYYHICIDGSSNLYCIPYNEETAHLLGTTDEWKGGEG